MKPSSKLLTFLFAFLITAWAAQAQEQEEITDEELTRYAVTMDSIEQMKASVLVKLEAKIKSHENITVARYNELLPALGNEAKMAELGATEEEILFMNEVNDMKNTLTVEIQTTFQTMAKDYIGVKSYKKIKDALSGDMDVKVRYENILAGIVQKEEEASEQKGNE
jgi:hypothetical protein